MNNSTTEIRQIFLDFFHNKDHQVVASSSLVPKNDKTLLFTNSGMNQFKDVFLGFEKRNYSNATSSQRCVRVGGKHNDLENVGYTSRHHTFFEMLGNFSFGDYFKSYAIQYAWELLTSKKWFNLLKERLLVTVYKTDDESYEIWRKEIGIPCERIVRIGDNKGIPYASDNFWQMGDTGPCGPCTEIFYDYGDHIYGRFPSNNKEENNRYIEIWNIVFMQFDRQIDGSMEPLLKPSVDTGMGLERITTVLQHVYSNYDIDIFRKLISSAAEITNVVNLNNKSLRVIADHIRSCAFLIVDGVIPSNENRGYVLRHIIRRAIRHGNMLGVKGTFFYKLVEPLIEVMGTIGEDLKNQQKQVEKLIKIEEEQFSYTLERGLALLTKELTKVSNNTLNGEIIFRLYDTYGFPADLTTEICREHNIKIDKVGFNAAMEKQRYRSRKLSNFNVNYHTMIHMNDKSYFDGYTKLTLHCNVIALFVNNKEVNSIGTNNEVVVFLDKTPFYAESGGQASDQGYFEGKNFRFEVNNVQKYGHAIGHVGKLLYGIMQVNDSIYANVHKTRRIRICLNHSATHLMYAALRKILGTHVVQKGSMINDTVLRFDFSHHEAMKLSELRAVENLVNMQIRSNVPIETHVMDLTTAKKKGVIALFDEKYDKYVRVLNMGDFSIELCGGTHASRTGDIGLFHITSESGTASGIRRIEAITGESAVIALQEQTDLIRRVMQLLKCDNQNLDKKICNILQYTHQLERKIWKFKEQEIIDRILNLSKKAIEIKGVKLLIDEYIEVDRKILHFIVKNLKNQLFSTIVVLTTILKDKVYLIVMVSENIIHLIKAKELINVITKQAGGKGGGSSDIAQAGGMHAASLPAVLSNLANWLNEKLQ